MRYIIGIIIGILLNAAISYDGAARVLTAIYNTDTQHIITAYHYGCLSNSKDGKTCKALTSAFGADIERVRELRE